jgi:aromatic-L-amino-acid decarboxylase
MVWAILRELGVAGMRQRVITDNSFARHVAQRAHADPRLEVLAEPVLSICGFRYRVEPPNQANPVNNQILRRLARETPVVVSSTVIDDQFMLRPCFINARTTIDDVDMFVDAVIRFGDELTR